ncbi:MAG: cytidylyltransferase domain-containing protein [Micrococcales bacterium]
MLNGLTVVAMIPARGGSKGLPGKNLMKLGDKSLIERAVDCARLQDGLVDMIVVSSDDDAILAEAERCGAIAHRRKAEAATDDATPADLLEDFFEGEDSLIINHDILVIYLQPTSPLRTPKHVAQALDIYRANNLKGSVVSVVQLEKSPYWTLIIQDGKLSPMFPEAFDKNRQELPPTFVPNGAIYLFKYTDFAEQRKIPTPGASAFVMSAQDSIDIDTRADFDKAAEMLEGR